MDDLEKLELIIKFINEEGYSRTFGNWLIDNEIDPNKFYSVSPKKEIISFDLWRAKNIHWEMGRGYMYRGHIVAERDLLDKYEQAIKLNL